MSFLKRIFGKQDGAAGNSDGSRPPPKPRTSDPAADPNMVRVFDSYGRELFITREQWRDKVLLGNLEKAKGDPESLAGLITSALRDGFAADVVAHAEHLHRTDPIPARSATLLGVVYLEVGRPADAERVLSDHLARRGEDPYVLTNLAKAQHALGERERAEATLWHGLELDPNQDAGFGWYVAMQRERGGDAAYLEACRRIATVPRSWRAQLWLARDALAKGDAVRAVALYRDGLSRAGQPAPAEFLMQMGGDLGKAGRLTQVVELVAPVFVAAQHGLEVGNNLIKANVDLGRLDDAKAVIDQLYEVKRPDWRSHLEFWDREVARARVEGKPQRPDSSQLGVAMVSIEGPLWLRDRSPCASLVPPKPEGSPRVALFGSTALMPPERTGERVQLSDGPGRLSRVLPLVMGEEVHLATSAAASVLIPWVNGAGFALFGQPYGDAELCKLARTEAAPRSFVVGAVVDVRGSDWGASFRVLRGEDGSCVGTGEVRADPNNPAPAVEELTSRLIRVLGEAGISAKQPPQWYGRPTGIQGTNYLLRLEQQLALTCSALESLEGKQLSGEHEIVEGAIDLALQQPSNVTMRILLAHTLRQMKKGRPELVALYRERVERLQREHPINGDAGHCISAVLADAFAVVSA